MKNIFLLYDTDPDASSRQAILFKDPVDIISCSNKSDIDDCLQRLDKAILDGYYAAGFLSYELGLYFQEIPFDKKSDFPLFLFGIFSSCEKIPLEKLESSSPLAGNTEPFSIENRSYSISPDTYNNDIKYIKEHIKAGNTYQVNYTFKHNFDFEGSSLKLFDHLRKTQDVPYAAFIDTNRWSIASLSPELFFRRNDDEMTVRPMKGTIKRGRTEDIFLRHSLEFLLYGGLLTAIVPLGVLFRGGYCEHLRNYIMENYQIITIIEVESGLIFQRSSISTAIIQIKAEKPDDDYEINVAIIKDKEDINNRFKTILIYKLNGRFGTTYKFYSILENKFANLLDAYLTLHDSFENLALERNITVQYLREIQDDLKDTNNVNFSKHEFLLLDKEAENWTKVMECYNVFRRKGLFLSLPRAYFLLEKMEKSVDNIIKIQQAIIDGPYN